MLMALLGPAHAHTGDDPLQSGQTVAQSRLIN